MRHANEEDEAYAVRGRLQPPTVSVGDTHDASKTKPFGHIVLPWTTRCILFSILSCPALP